MAERTSTSLESVVTELAARLGRLEARVAELEGRPAACGQGVGRRACPSADLAAATPACRRAHWPSLGRTLLVLAGAYLVRALTDGQVLPAAAGVALGLAYAAVFQLLADREALAGRHASAVFHDVASSAIAFPLIWEATARFALIPPRVGYAALVAFFALGIGVAWHRRLRANAVVTTFLALATAVSLLVATHDLIAAIAALVAVAAGVEWLAWRGAWLGLRWASAAVLDAAAALLVAVATRPAWPEGYPPLSSDLARRRCSRCPRFTWSSVAARTLRRGEAVTAFEVVQGALALLLGFGGAMNVLGAHGLPADGARRARSPPRRALLRRGVLGGRAAARTGPQLLPVLDGRRGADAGGNRAPRRRARAGRRVVGARPRRRVARPPVRPDDAAGARGAIRARGRAPHGVAAERSRALAAAPSRDSRRLWRGSWPSRRSPPGPCSRAIRALRAAASARAPQLLLAALGRPRRRQGRAGCALAGRGPVARGGPRGGRRRAHGRARRARARPRGGRGAPRARRAAVARLPGRRARRAQVADAGRAPGPAGDARREPRPLRSRARPPAPAHEGPRPDRRP